MIYPGLPDHPQAALARRQMETGGTMLSLELAGGKAAAFRFLDALRIVLISNNLGDAKSLVTHPATTTHQRLTAEQRAALGIGDGLVRLSVGLEDPADLHRRSPRSRWRRNECRNKPNSINAIAFSLNFPSLVVSASSQAAHNTRDVTFQFEAEHPI